jgi:NAD(P)-dependent dehydrogenase (short-subunit alcohol dehydrogenase family)
MIEKHSFVVTGANSYLGRAFAKKLSNKDNYKVFLTSRGKFNFNGLLKKKNVSYLPEIDLSIESDTNKLAVAVNNFLPGRFHVINCLGFFPGYDTIEEINIETAKKIFESNVIALYSVANNLLPLMCKRKGGHFIGFSTHTSYQHYPRMVAFTAAKAAVESMIRGIANEYLAKGINANTIALATLLTETELKIKPKGDSKNWLNTDEVCDFVENIILQPNKLISGNVIHIYKYSESFFHQSYYDRIRNDKK